MAVKTSRLLASRNISVSGIVDVVGQVGAGQRRVEALLDQRLELRLAFVVDGDLRAQLRTRPGHLVLNRAVARD